MGRRLNLSQQAVYLEVASIPIAAANIISVAVQPRIFVNCPFTALPITFLLFEMSIMIASNGGDKRPLITAVQKSALMGLIPTKFVSVPMSVEMAMTA